MIGPPLGDIVLGSRVASRAGSLGVASACVAMVAALTDAELREAWRSAHERLERLRAQPDRTTALAAVALERSWYLDEIEGRTHVGFAPWVSSGADPEAMPAMAPLAVDGEIPWQPPD